MDVTGTCIERLRLDPASPSGLSTVYEDRIEPVVAIDVLTDVLTDVPADGRILEKTFIVARRNDGPLVSVNMAAGTALSVQYAGFSPTTELEAFRRLYPQDLIGVVDAVTVFLPARRP